MAVAPVMAHDIEVVAVVEPVAPRCLSHRPSMLLRGDDLSEPYQWQVTKQGSRLPPCYIHVTECGVHCCIWNPLDITGEPCPHLRRGSTGSGSWKHAVGQPAEFATPQPSPASRSLSATATAGCTHDA